MNQMHAVVLDTSWCETSGMYPISWSRLTEGWNFLPAKHLVGPVAKNATAVQYIMIVSFQNPLVSLHHSVLFHHLISIAWLAAGLHTQAAKDRKATLTPTTLSLRLSEGKSQHPPETAALAVNQFLPGYRLSAPSPWVITVRLFTAELVQHGLVWFGPMLSSVVIQGAQGFRHRCLRLLLVLSVLLFFDGHFNSLSSDSLTPSKVSSHAPLSSSVSWIMQAHAGSPDCSDLDQWAWGSLSPLKQSELSWCPSNKGTWTFPSSSFALMRMSSWTDYFMGN